jgi:hypothetical protein
MMEAVGVSLSSYNADEIAEAQCKENAFCSLIEFLESGETPSESELILIWGPKKNVTFWRGVS